MGLKPTILRQVRPPLSLSPPQNVVERCFCRLKDFRRMATGYDKLARNFFSALCFVATLAYWL
jgi:transposase